jgi:hypothetical protein
MLFYDASTFRHTSTGNEPNCRVIWYLLFVNVVDQFNAGNHQACIVWFLQTEHRLQPKCDLTVILLHCVIQVRQQRILTGFCQWKLNSFCMPIIHSAEWLGSKPSRVIVRGSPCRFNAFRQNALAAALSRVRLKYVSMVFAALIDGKIQKHHLPPTLTWVSSARHERPTDLSKARQRFSISVECRTTQRRIVLGTTDTPSSQAMAAISL